MTSITFDTMEGYAFGAQQPLAVLTFDAESQLPPSPNGILAHLFQHAELPPLNDMFTHTLANVSQTATATELVRLVAHLNTQCGDQRFTPITASKDGSQYVYYVPSLLPSLTAENLKAVITFAQKHSTGATSADLSAFMASCISRGQRLLPKGTNTENFIATAGRYRIPQKLVASQYLALGYGSGSAIFNSSISDRESQIGTSMASNKAHANSFLKTIGLPVAEHIPVNSAAAARAAAAKTGYPVVLKPLDEEQGRGVVVDIRNDAELTYNFTALSKTYPRLAVENHITGELYRINTLEGVFIRAIKRVPARIVGDGTSTIAALIDAFNAQPLRNDPGTYTKRLPLDSELTSYLKKQSLTLETVPEPGRTIQLTPIWKSSRGGHSEDVTQLLHPENIALCETVARSFRLRVTGIDLISSDATVSWRDNGAIICEVNARPQLGITHPDIYRQILAKRVGAPPPVHLRISANGPREVSSLYDPAAKSLSVQLPVSEVLENGSPTQYFTSLDIAEDVSVSDRAKLKNLLVSVDPLPLE
jgi:D-alanine-D-alanine ligase-like ATP-grasp enzyme